MRTNFFRHKILVRCLTGHCHTDIGSGRSLSSPKEGNESHRESDCMTVHERYVYRVIVPQSHSDKIFRFKNVPLFFLMCYYLYSTKYFTAKIFYLFIKHK